MKIFLTKRKILKKTRHKKNLVQTIEHISRVTLCTIQLILFGNKNKNGNHHHDDGRQSNVMLSVFLIVAYRSWLVGWLVFLLVMIGKKTNNYTDNA